MRRGFWFLAGAAASAYVTVKGQRLYRRLTPAGMSEQIESEVGRRRVQATDWVTDFADTYRRAHAAKKSELTALLVQDERRELT
ncbi:DUF6167 family protein [Nigerium massiliense]|uniref:DUF6167 family protein n=1 Tax=Nigerium massiliense TaxID=1522317 RepID=UPI00058EEEEC|nr:DUF6167 family protein [Nigerium massiliense]